VGIVDALGADVTSTRIGQRIAHHSDLRRQGGLAQYAVAEAAVLAAVPARLDAVTTAALPCAAMTAYQAVVRRLRVEPGDTVLVTGGAGGVGGFAVQLASLAGGHVIATASTWNADHVLGLGAHEVFDYHSEDIAALVRQLTHGRGLDGVVDTVGSASATENLRLSTSSPRYAGRPATRTLSHSSRTCPCKVKFAVSPESSPGPIPSWTSW
jgi:NADPH:quinone reductase-like Zn-dependent oxidoreductase